MHGGALLATSRSLAWSEPVRLAWPTTFRHTLAALRLAGDLAQPDVGYGPLTLGSGQNSVRARV